MGEAPVTEFAELRGRRIASWTGVEMALREEGPGGGPQFEDPAVPCLQLTLVGAQLVDGVFVTVSTYWSGARCGLWLRREFGPAPDWARLTGGIYRVRTLPELPAGRVDDVTVVLDDDGAVVEVVLHVEGRPLLLMAGEVEETPRGGLRFLRRDESVLVFADPAAADPVDWIPSRRTPVRG